MSKEQRYLLTEEEFATAKQRALTADPEKERAVGFAATA